MYCKVHVHVQYIPSLCRACAMCICGAGAGAATQPLEAEETRARVLLLLLSCPNTVDMCCLFTFHCSLAFSSASLSVLERIRLDTLSEIQITGKPTESCTFFNHLQPTRRLGRDTCQLSKSKKKSKKENTKAGRNARQNKVHACRDRESTYCTYRSSDPGFEAHASLLHRSRTGCIPT